MKDAHLSLEARPGLPSAPETLRFQSKEFRKDTKSTEDRLLQSKPRHL